jgi:hypothetical protein
MGDAAAAPTRLGGHGPAPGDRVEPAGLALMTHTGATWVTAAVDAALSIAPSGWPGCASDTLNAVDLTPSEGSRHRQHRPTPMTGMGRWRRRPPPAPAAAKVLGNFG